MIQRQPRFTHFPYPSSQPAELVGVRESSVPIGIGGRERKKKKEKKRKKKRKKHGNKNKSYDVLRLKKINF